MEKAPYHMGLRDLDVDVVVVGGGPAGACAARAAAEAGVSVLLVEEHRQAGRPVQCTGLLSARGVGLLRVPPRIRLREITGAFIYAPDGTRLSLGGRKLQAYVIARDRLDQQLLHRAAGSGVEIHTGVRAIGWARDGDGGALRLLDLKTRQVRSVHARVLIGADGPHSRVARWARLPRPAKALWGVQVVVPHTPEREDFVEVFLGRAVAPNFFAWAVPAAPGRARVGLATDRGRSARPALDRLLQDRYSTKVLEAQGGTIPIGPARRTVSDGVLLVGDAAGQAKPTSGGGIYTGALCGRIAGEVAARCIRAGDGDTSAEALAQYERRWRAALERELTLGWQAHRLLCRLSDAQLDRLFAWLAQEEVRDILEEHGDIDYPSRIVQALLRRPRLWKRALRLIPPGLWWQEALLLAGK